MTASIEIRLVGRVPTPADLPATGVYADCYAVEAGRQFAGWGDQWVFGPWDEGGARDYFGLDLDEVPEVGP